MARLHDMPHGVGLGRKCRDIFPLPTLLQSNCDIGLVSRKCARRKLVSKHVEEEINYTIQSLNSMYGCGSSGKSFISLDECLFGTAMAQYDSLEFIESCVRAMGKPPVDLDRRGAFNMLQAASGYSEDQPAGSLASFNAEIVSLPEEGWTPINLVDLWGDDGQIILDDFVSNQLLPPETASIRLEACGVDRPYMDPMLRQGKSYHGFLKRLHASSLVDYSVRPGREQIGLFFVTKKNGKLRLIVDARRSNAHFGEPSYVSLSTGDSLGSLEFESGCEVTVAMADLKDAFYHLSLPVCLRDFFCLPSVRARDVGVFSLDGKRLRGDEKLTPRLAVVPMGWSWALYMCQSIHESLALKGGLTEEFRIRDRKPPPDSACCHTQYVDNMIVLGTNDSAVRDAYRRAVATLKEAGLQVHEEEVDFGATLLGWEITNRACSGHLEEGPGRSGLHLESCCHEGEVLHISWKS